MKEPEYTERPKALENSTRESFLVGRIIKRVVTPKGSDFFVILADGTAKGKRFRADARQFACPDKIRPDTIISFYPDDAAKQSSVLTTGKVEVVQGTHGKAERNSRKVH
jgi:hypothetical protein